jgi:ABC-type branched-subunit amino acid transport system substrate-binding protein
VGITPDRIVVGIPVPDTSALGDTEGGVQFGETLGDFRAQYQAGIDELNAKGGVNGRQVVAEYRLYKAGDLDDMRAACVYLTEQKKVFAVLGGFFGDPILCVTEQHHTLMLAQASEPDDFYARSQGMFFSITASKDRILGDLAASLHRDGALRGRTIGVLDQEGIDAIPVDRTLLPQLERLGYDVAYHARIANDVGAAQSQIPLEVQRMRGAGVDTVIVASGLIRATVFIQEAQNQRWRPQYLLSDFASGSTDVYTLAMPDSFEGALAYTSFRTGEGRAGRPEAAHDAACREVYERRTGERLDRKTIEYFYAVTACGIVDLFGRGMVGAGPNPTRASLSQALQDLGTFDVPYGSTGSFRPGKFDAPDTTRRVAWKLDCKCWLPVDEFKATST